MNEEIKRATKVCPRCQKPYIGYPAISRVDNRTRICSDCGEEEARMAAIMYRNKLRNQQEEGK